MCVPGKKSNTLSVVNVSKWLMGSSLNSHNLNNHSELSASSYYSVS